MAAPGRRWDLFYYDGSDIYQQVARSLVLYVDGQTSGASPTTLKPGMPTKFTTQAAYLATEPLFTPGSYVTITNTAGTVKAYCEVVDCYEDTQISPSRIGVTLLPFHSTADVGDVINYKFDDGSIIKCDRTIGTTHRKMIIDLTDAPSDAEYQYLVIASASFNTGGEDQPVSSTAVYDQAGNVWVRKGKHGDPFDGTKYGEAIIWSANFTPDGSGGVTPTAQWSHFYSVSHHTLTPGDVYDISIQFGAKANKSFIRAGRVLAFRIDPETSYISGDGKAEAITAASNSTSIATTPVVAGGEDYLVFGSWTHQMNQSFIQSNSGNYHVKSKSSFAGSIGHANDQLGQSDWALQHVATDAGTDNAMCFGFATKRTIPSDADSPHIFLEADKHSSGADVGNGEPTVITSHCLAAVKAPEYLENHVVLHDDSSYDSADRHRLSTGGADDWSALVPSFHDQYSYVSDFSSSIDGWEQNNSGDGATLAIDSGALKWDLAAVAGSDHYISIDMSGISRIRKNRQYKFSGKVLIPTTNTNTYTLTLALEQPDSNYDHDRTIVTIRGDARGGPGLEPSALLDYSTWTVGGGLTGRGTWDGFFSYGETETNEIVSATGPFGVTRPIWESLGNDAAEDADGGWHSQWFTIDPTKLYRFSVWVKREAAGDGNFLFGAFAANSSGTPVVLHSNRTDDATSVETDNPYFDQVIDWVKSETTHPGHPSLGFDKWYLVVGHVHPHNNIVYGDHADSGWYEAGSPTKLSELRTNTGIDGGDGHNTGGDWRWADTNSVNARHRSYLYHSSDSSVNQQWAMPRVDLCDGTEPSIAELVGSVGWPFGEDWQDFSATFVAIDDAPDVELYAWGRHYPDPAWGLSFTPGSSDYIKIKDFSFERFDPTTLLTKGKWIEFISSSVGLRHDGGPTNIAVRPSFDGLYDRTEIYEVADTLRTDHDIPLTFFAPTDRDTSIISYKYTSDFSLWGSQETQPSAFIDYNLWWVGMGMATVPGLPQYTTNNSMVSDIGPFGFYEPIWRAIGDVAEDGDGGWNSDLFTIDPTKLYRFSVWVKRKVAGDGRFFFGAYGYQDSTNIGLHRQTSSDSLDSNRYFTYSNKDGANQWDDDKSIDQWYLVVGHIHPHTDASNTDHADSGYYLLGSTTKTHTLDLHGTASGMGDLRWDANNNKAKHRSYLWYSTDLFTNQQWAMPRVDLCDGTEPSIAELVGDTGKPYVDSWVPNLNDKGETLDFDAVRLDESLGMAHSTGGMAFDSGGNLFYTSDLGGFIAQLRKLPPTPGVPEVIFQESDATSLGGRVFDGPYHCAVDSQDNVYVTSASLWNGASYSGTTNWDNRASASGKSDAVFKITPSGTKTVFLPHSGDSVVGEERDYATCIMDIVIDSRDNVYVLALCNQYGTNVIDNDNYDAAHARGSIFRITSGGTISRLTTYDGTYGWGLALNSSDDLFVARHNYGVYKITNPGGYNQLDEAATEAITTVFLESGTPIPTHTPAPTSRAHGLTGIDVDSLGNVYVSSYYAWNVWKIEPDGTETEIIPSDAGVAYPHSARSVAVDGLGNIYYMGLGNEAADTTYRNEVILRRDASTGTISTVITENRSVGGVTLNRPRGFVIKPGTNEVFASHEGGIFQLNTDAMKFTLAQTYSNEHFVKREIPALEKNRSYTLKGKILIPGTNDEVNVVAIGTSATDSSQIFATITTGISEDEWQDFEVTFRNEAVSRTTLYVSAWQGTFGVSHTPDENPHEYIKMKDFSLEWAGKINYLEAKIPSSAAGGIISKYTSFLWMKKRDPVVVADDDPVTTLVDIEMAVNATYGWELVAGQTHGNIWKYTGKTSTGDTLVELEDPVRLVAGLTTGQQEFTRVAHPSDPLDLADDQPTPLLPSGESAWYRWSFDKTNKTVYAVWLAAINVTPNNVLVFTVISDSRRYSRKLEHINWSGASVDGGLTPYYPRLLDVPGSKQDLSSSSGGASVSASLGTIELANADGEFDDLFAQRSFEAQKVKIRRGFSGVSNDILDFEVLADGVMGIPRIDNETISIPIFDNSITLNRQVSKAEVTAYESYNEKVEDDSLKSIKTEHVPIPRIYGRLRRAYAVRVTDNHGHTEWNTYQVCSHAISSMCGTDQHIYENGDDTESLKAKFDRIGQEKSPAVSFGDYPAMGSASTYVDLQASYVDAGKFRVKNSAFIEQNDEAADSGDAKYIPDGVYVDLIGATDNNLYTGNPILLPGEIISNLLTLADVAAKDINAYSLHMINRNWRPLVDEDTKVIADNVGVDCSLLVSQEMTTAEALDLICKSIFAYWYTDRQGRIAVGVPNLDAGNVIPDVSFEFSEKLRAASNTYHKWANNLSTIAMWPSEAGALGSPLTASEGTQSIVTSPYKGGNALRFTPETTNPNESCRVLAPIHKDGLWAFTCVAKWVSGTVSNITQDATENKDFTLRLHTPSGTIGTGSKHVIELNRWNRVSSVFEVDPGQTGDCWLEVVPIKTDSNASGTTIFDIDMVEGYPVFADVTVSNAEYEGTEMNDEIYYVARVRFNVNLQNEGVSSIASRQDDTAMGYGATDSEGKHYMRTSALISIEDSLLGQVNDGLGVATGLVAYYARPRARMSLVLLGMNQIPQVGEYLHVSSLPRVPQQLLPYPIWRIVSVDFSGKSAQTLNVVAEQAFDLRHDSLLRNA